MNSSLPMSKKQFVSIAFFQKKIQVLVLNSEKNQVVKFVNCDIPSDLIINYQVQNQEVLGKILKNIWLQQGFKEKSVGIVVPEFSTFTKLLKLPKLNVDDLDEAVKWQIQDTLPLHTNQEIVVDWKIVSENETEYEILAIVIQKNILSGYVDACGVAGLYPLMVETPSVSLTRIISSEKDAKLIIYSHFGSSILILSEGEKIFGSSIVPSNDQSAIIRTATQILNHFQSIKVKKIKVGGLEFNKNFLSFLSRNYNVPVEWMTITSVSGLTPGQMQEYLIPLSMQLSQPSEPKSEQSINLLPPSWVQKYQYKKLNLQVWSLTTLSTIVVTSCFLISLVFYLLLTMQARNLPTEQDNNLNLPKQEIAQVNAINKLSEKVVKIGKASYIPQEIINEITLLKVAGLHIITYQLDFDSGKITVKGSADNRQVLIDFKNALEDDENLEDITIPLSSFEKEDNLEFEITFLYKSLKETQVIIPVLKQ